MSAGLAGDIRDVDPTALGMEMIRLMAVSITAGHSTPVGTVRDYFCPDRPEGQFIKDFVLGRQRREQLIDRWFRGSEVAASNLVSLSADKVMAEIRLAAEARRAGSAA